jgi:hypothetical protein
MFKPLLLSLVIALGFTSCGSVSTLQTRDGKPVAAAAASYRRVVVKEFTHTVADDDGTTPIAARKFSAKVAAAISKAKPGVEVARGSKGGSGTLVISGEVTRYAEGNAALRFLVGMGAGSSYFDANLYFTDGGTGKEIGMIKVDKNSWALGGGLAATQTVESYMNGGAETAASEAAKLIR